MVAYLLSFLLLLKVQNNYKDNVLKFFSVILYKVIPLVGFLNKTLSGKKYKIPCFLPKKKAINIGLRWLIKNANLRSEKTFGLKLLGEFNDILVNKSKTIKQRNEHHALAFDNRQYLYLLRKRK